MSIRIYIGNLPQGFNPKEFDTLLKSVSDSIRFKAVLDKETKECRGFGFATTNNEEKHVTVAALRKNKFLTFCKHKNRHKRLPTRSF